MDTIRLSASNPALPVDTGKLGGLITIALLFFALSAAGWAAEIESRRLPLFTEDVVQIPGDTAAKDFAVLLPSHFSYVAGSEIALTLRPSGPWLSEVCAVHLSLNGRKLISFPVAGTDLTNQTAIALQAAIPSDALFAQWNRVSLEFLLQRSTNMGALKSGSWELRRAEAHLSLASQRLPLFSELGRFPESFAEVRLFGALASTNDSGQPVVSILWPRERTDAHWRASVIVGARFGQLGFLTPGDCRLALLEDWEKEATQRHAVVIGLSNEVRSLPLPENVSAVLEQLQQGQGLLAEFIIAGAAPRRCLIVSGADVAGLEKAALTLGSTHALRSIPNPAVIMALPPTLAEAKAPRLVPAIGLTPLRLQGIGQSERSASGWLLPPGSKLAAEGILNLRLSHSPTLRSPDSILEVLINGMTLRTIPLMPENAMLHTVALALPRELAGADPTMLTFRAYLDLDPTVCEQRTEEQAWVAISQGSTVEARTEAAEVASLDQLQTLLVRGESLGRTALLIPAGASLEEAQLVFDFAMRLGQRVPSAATLWPEAATFRPGVAPVVVKLQDRSVLLLSSVREWPKGLPPKVVPAVQASGGQNGSVLIQGRREYVDRFEPSIVFAQLMNSPWSNGEKLVLAGGWNGFASPAMRRLLMDPASVGKTPGDLGAMDAHGRGVGYESAKVSSDSFAERIRRQMPLGLDAEQTRQRLDTERTREVEAARINRWMLWICGGLVVLLAGSRVLLTLPRRRASDAAPKPTTKTA